MFGQAYAIAGIFADVRIFWQKPVQKSRYQDQKQIEKIFKPFEHFGF
jgi:hypothetical protein